MANANVCDCQNPPGGQVRCEAHQMALCIVQDGVARYQCLDPPGTSPVSRLVRTMTLRGPVQAPELMVWALGKIIGGRGVASAIEALDHAHVLLGDRFVRPDGAVVTFSLPEKLRGAMESTLRSAAVDAPSRYRNG